VSCVKPVDGFITHSDFSSFLCPQEAYVPRATQAE
jgi:hypothetical protein